MNPHSDKLLLVHEDIEVVGSIFSSLVSEGFQVGLAFNGELALQILEDHDFDVVVVSASMRSGVETRLFELLQQRHPQLPLVLLTEDDLVDQGRTLANIEAFAYLIKPFDSHQISALSHVAIDRSVPATAQLP